MRPVPVFTSEKVSIDDVSTTSHIYYHLILRQCSMAEYPDRIEEHKAVGCIVVASFFEQADSETHSLHFHCLVRLPCAKKTYEDRFRAKFKTRNLHVIKQIKPPSLDPKHLENTLLYISKDGRKVADDGSIKWEDYLGKRQVPEKSKKSKPTFNEYLVDEFRIELKTNPHLYKSIPVNYPEYEPNLIERSTIHWLKKHFTSKYRDFDELILIRKYHFLNSMFSLGGVDVADLAINKLLKY